MSLSKEHENHRVAIVHNALFIAALDKSITALSLPISEGNGVNWAGKYVINNKPTQIEGI